MVWACSKVSTDVSQGKAPACESGPQSVQRGNFIVRLYCLIWTHNVTFSPSFLSAASSASGPSRRCGLATA